MQNHLLILWVKHADIGAWENLLPEDLIPQTTSAVELRGGVTLWVTGEQKALL